jgi:HNH endonuclease
MTKFDDVVRGFEINAVLVLGSHVGFICPICHKSSQPTEDHFPPRNIGGKRWSVPTCGDCNHRLGSSLESQIPRYGSYWSLVERTGAHPKILRWDRTKHPVLATRRSDQVALVARDEEHETTAIVLSKLAPLAGTGESILPEGVAIEDDPRYSFELRTVLNAYLKSAYLALFHFLGYRAVLSAALSPIRERLLSNDESVPVYVGFSSRQDVIKKDIQLAVIVAPEDAQAILVKFIGFDAVGVRNGRAEPTDVSVLLPLPTDRDLKKYRRAIGQISHPDQIEAIEFDGVLRDASIPLLVYDDGKELQLTPSRTYYPAARLKEQAT